jgi:hypothetical protein
VSLFNKNLQAAPSVGRYGFARRPEELTKQSGAEQETCVEVRRVKTKSLVLNVEWFQER